ncbi:MAG: hypothetical protein AAFO58_09765 [Pseudomonadota bacterium]
MYRIIAATALALTTTAASATTFVDTIDVVADVSAIKNLQGAAVWDNIERDMEEALALRLVDQITEEGADVLIEMDTIALANGLTNAIGLADAQLAGSVAIVVPGSANDIRYDLTVNADQLTIPLTDAGAPIYTASAEFYAEMINTFADNVADRLQ